MHKMCCLFSLVWELFECIHSASVLGDLVAAIRPRKWRNSRWFCASVQRVSLPYLAFSSKPAPQLRHFLWALSTCSAYCAGIFYIWQEVGLCLLACRPPFLAVREVNSIICEVVCPPLLVKDDCGKRDSTWEEYVTFLTTASKMSCCHLRVIDTLHCQRVRIICLLKYRRNKKEQS